jgi:Spy/CpxP family protein refolding chaperone
MNVPQKALATAALSVLLLAPALAQAKTPPPPAAADATTAEGLLHHPRALARFLHLSADQTTQLLAFDKTLQTAVEPLRQARVPLCAQLRTDLTAATPDPGTVGADTLSLYDNKLQIRAAREAFDTSFSAILNPEQLARYDALKVLGNFLNGPGTDVIGDCPPAS